MTTTTTTGELLICPTCRRLAVHLPGGPLHTDTLAPQCTLATDCRPDHTPHPDPNPDPAPDHSQPPPGRQHTRPVDPPDPSTPLTAGLGQWRPAGVVPAAETTRPVPGTAPATAGQPATATAGDALHRWCGDPAPARHRAGRPGRFT
jgi:hypothetical protein